MSILQKLNIVMFGNINNWPFLLAKGLRLIGHNVTLIINRKETMHRPEALHPKWKDSYPNWIVDCSYITDDDIIYKTPSINQILNYLSQNVDVVILNDIGPTLSSYVRSPHAVVLTGSDLSHYADFKSLINRSSCWVSDYKRSVVGRQNLILMSDSIARQRDGILAAEIVCYPNRGMIPSGDALLDEIGVEDKRRLMLYISNTIDNKPIAAPNNEQLNILCGSRIVYNAKSHPYLGAIDFKGTDILIRGYAKYVKAGGRGILRLVKKGQDVNCAISLIAKLGIESNIDWLDEMPLKKFYKEMAKADLICDQFGTSFPGMVTADAYALGRPVLSKLCNNHFKKIFPEPLPGFDAVTSKQIADHLITIDSNRQLLIDMGSKSYAYAEQFLSPLRMARNLLNAMGFC